MRKLVQATEACLGCGSWYRLEKRGGTCNVCGRDCCDDRPEPVDRQFSGAGKQCFGMLWNKKEHKVVCR